MTQQLELDHEAPIVDLNPIIETSHGRLYHNDCLNVLPTIKAETIDLIFADPPFNLGKEYGTTINDSLSRDEYLSWCRRWVRECVRVLKRGGSFFLIQPAGLERRARSLPQH